ncbi:MAG TPA: HIRAN domain-containing protein [Tepidisphaeraceae bacterium]|nr:HIRAN domain-containing protein [Tepidisphaeraceae bacterium]
MRPGGGLCLGGGRYNPHDGNAIRVMAGVHMIGYIPRGPNAEIARRLDRAEALVCRVERVNPRSRSWKQVEICVESMTLARPWWCEDELDIDEDDGDRVFSTDRDSATDLSFDAY